MPRALGEEPAALTRDTASLFSPPETIGPYRVLHQVGAGVLGPVFRALDPDQDRMVGIKLFRLEMPPEQAARLAAHLTGLVEAQPAHEGLVPLRGAGVEGTNAYLVMDYVAADSLDQRLRRRVATPLDQALPLLDQVAAALDAAGAAGQFHGALHPRDILVSTRGAVTVTGVGVTQCLEAAGWRAPFRRPYAAPERLAARAWGARADVFSLGVLTLELATGRRPLMPESGAALQWIGLGDEERTSAVRAVLTRALDENAAVREASAGAWARLLAAAVRGQPLPAAGDDRPGDRLDARAGLTVPSAPAPAAAVAEPNDLHLGAAGPDASDQVAIDDLPLLQAQVEPEPRAEDAAATEVGEETTEPVDTDSAGEPPRVVEASDATPLLTAESDAEAAPELIDLRDRPSAADAPRRAPEAAAPPNAAVRRGRRESAGPPGRRWVFAAAAAGLATGFFVGYWSGSLDRRAPVAPTPAATEAPASADAGDTGPGAGAAAPLPAQASPSRAAAPPRARPPVPVRPAARAAATAAPARAAPAQAPAEGRVLVRSTPAGAEVRLDGAPAGRTPAALRNLSYRSYRVTVTAPGLAPVTRDVRLTAEAPSATLTIDLTTVASSASTVAGPALAATGSATETASVTGEAAIEIVSRPPGARVLLDGRAVGTAPLRVTGLTPGAHAVRLELDGHRPWTDTVQVNPGRLTRVAASLEPNPQS